MNSTPASGSSTGPLVSLLMPVRNSARTIEETVRSILYQTEQDFELVLVDDASEDNTVAIVQQMFAGDTRLHIISAARVGLVQALKRGLNHCRSNYVARMDGDDIMVKDRLALQLNALQSDPTLQIISGLVCCFAGDFNPKWLDTEPCLAHASNKSEGPLNAARGDSVNAYGIAPGYVHYQNWLNAQVAWDEIVRERFVESPLAHPSVMFRRDAILAIGGYHELTWPEDYDLWLRAINVGYKISKIPKTLLFWRDHKNRASRQQSRYKNDAFLRCKAHYLAIGPLSASGKVLIWGGSNVARRLGRHLQEEGIKIIAYVDIDPNKIGRTRRGAPVISPHELQQYSATDTDRLPLIAAVGRRGARELIRTDVIKMGWTEGDNFFCAA